MNNSLTIHDENCNLNILRSLKMLSPCIEEQQSATGTPRKKVFLNNANNNEAHTESKEK